MRWIVPFSVVHSHLDQKYVIRDRMLICIQNELMAGSIITQTKMNT